MAQVILRIFDATPNPWNTDTREVMIDVSSNLLDLSWDYKPAEGGVFGGKAKFRVVSGTPAYKKLTKGTAGPYWLYWLPDNASERTITNLDAYEKNFILSFGTVENINLDVASNVCSVDLKGPAQHLANELVTEISTEKDLVGQIAYDVMTSMVTSNGLIRDITAQKSGASNRKINFKESKQKASGALRRLQSSVGGPNMFGYGIRPAGGAEDLGEVYFESFKGADELASGNVKATWMIPKTEIVTLKARTRDSDVRNVITVSSNKTELPPTATATSSATFFSGTARNAYSIDVHGERPLTVFDSSVRNATGATELASTLAEEKANPKDEIEVTANIELDGGSQG